MGETTILTGRHLQELRKYPNSLYHWMKAEFLFHSNKMEGSTFSEEQFALLMNKGVVLGEHTLEDVIETANSIKVFEYMVDTLAQPLSEDPILEFHRLLKTGTRDDEIGLCGVWKKYENKLFGVPVRLAHPLEVPEAIKNLLYRWEYSNKDFMAIVRFHGDFEKIHPFQDGNGRVGRFLMMKQCLENEVSPIVIDTEWSRQYKSDLGVYQMTGDVVPLENTLRQCQERFASKEIVQSTLETMNGEK